jgi:hypothetical protein
MRISSSIFSAFVFVSFHLQHVSAQTAYTLASFDKDAIPGLSPACNMVHHATIPGCTASDFVNMNACSADCINGLTALQTQAQATCSSAITSSPNSMLAYFAKGEGVKDLCTLQKAAAAATPSSTTMVTSTRTATPSSTADSAAAASATIVGSDTRMSLPGGTVIAIIVAVVIAFAVLLIVAVVLYRRNYRN